MNKNNFNIDDFFEEARKNTPVISQEEVRNLLRNTAQNNVSIFNRFWKIIRGVPIMFKLTAAFAAASTIGIVGYNAINPDFSLINSKQSVPHEKVRSIDNNSQNIQKNITENNQIEEPKKVLYASNSIKKEDTKEEQKQATDNKLFESKKIDIKGIHLIELSKEEVENLGIKVIQNTDEPGKLIYKDYWGSKPMLCTLLVKGGMMTNFKDTFNISDQKDMKIFTPRLITDNAGNRRVCIFDENSDHVMNIEYVTAEPEDSEDNLKTQSKTSMTIIKNKNDKDRKPTAMIVKDKRFMINKNDSSCNSKNLLILDSMNCMNNMSLFFNADSTSRLINDSVYMVMGRIKELNFDSLGLGLSDLGKGLGEMSNGLDKLIYLKLDSLGLGLNAMSEGLAKMSKEFNSANEDFDNSDTTHNKKHKEFYKKVWKQNWDSVAKIYKYQADSLNKFFKSYKMNFNWDSVKKANKFLIDSIQKKMKINYDSKLRNYKIYIDSSLNHTQGSSRVFDTPYKVDCDLVNPQIKVTKKIIKINDSTGPNIEYKIALQNQNQNQNQNQVQINLDTLNARMINLNSSLQSIDENFAKYININKMIPIVVPMGKNTNINKYNDAEQFAFILWFDPSMKLLDKLPERVREKLTPEIKALSESTAGCKTAPVTGEDTYFDVWRACSGAIENLQIFPNPASDKVTVQYNLTSKRQISIFLHDLNGRRIRELSKPETQSPGTYNETYFLNNIKPGMYLISVQTEIEEQAVQRIVIDK